MNDGSTSQPLVLPCSFLVGVPHGPTSTANPAAGAFDRTQRARARGRLLASTDRFVSLDGEHHRWER